MIHLALSKKIFLKGFSLLEILMVVAIIGILATVIFAAMGRAKLQARDARRKADMKQIFEGMVMYYDSKSSAYPDLPDANEGVAIGPNDNTLSPFLEIMPLDPGGRTYYWTDRASTLRQRYCVWVQLEGNSDYIIANQSSVKEVSQDPGTVDCRTL